MPTIFTQIIEGRLPARFVWKDDRCVVFLSNRPLRPGHSLVVPRQEIDHWIDLDASLLAHLAETAQAIGRAQMKGFNPERIGVTIAGLEVPHCHLHVVPINHPGELSFDHVDSAPNLDAIEDAAVRLRARLRELGRDEVADA